jgi:hypothetical protein
VILPLPPDYVKFWSKRRRTHSGYDPLITRPSTQYHRRQVNISTEVVVVVRFTFLGRVLEHAKPMEIRGMSAEIFQRRSAACRMLEVARLDVRHQLHHIAAARQQCATTAVCQTRLCLPALSTEPTTPPLRNRPNHLTHSFRIYVRSYQYPGRSTHPQICSTQVS